MKVVILAGGFGTRLSEETIVKPKPMVEIGGMPMLWHIMKIYSSQGFIDFVICLGYKGYMIKEYFANYFLHQSNVTIDVAQNKIEIHNTTADPWKITLVDTGLNTMTGGRIKRIEPYVSGEKFMLTYGDGLGDVDLKALSGFHSSHKGLLSVTAVQPSGRFGSLSFDDNNRVDLFAEKPKGERGWINGGFFICDPEVINYIDDDSSIWERGPMEKLSEENLMFAYKHSGFWQCMDTIRDRNNLEENWNSENPSWKLW